jgi:hypothetical protein
MSRFDGARQGLGVWLIGLITTILLAIAGAILGSSFNLLAQLNLPTVPDASSLEIGALITLVFGPRRHSPRRPWWGKAGQRYHSKVDRALG